MVRSDTESTSSHNSVATGVIIKYTYVYRESKVPKTKKIQVTLDESQYQELARIGRREGYGLRFIRLPEETARKIRELLHTTTDSTPTNPLGQKYGDYFQTEEEQPEGPPYPLQEESLLSHAPDRPGIFSLSYDRTQEARMGRADHSLRGTLASFVGEYAYFYCEIIEDERERFLGECKSFHRLGGERGQLDNLEHPTPPSRSGLECPVCLQSTATSSHRA